MTKKIIKPLSVFSFLSGALIYSRIAQATTMPGKIFFKDTCSRCHSSGPESFTTPITDIKTSLHSNTIRKHRFTLTDEQIDQLLEYFSASKTSSAY